MIFCLLKNCLLSFISTMSNEAGLVASGVGMGSGMCVAGRLLGGALTVESFARVA